MTSVRNISTGPRGIATADRRIVTLEAGETRELDLPEDAEPGEWFAFDGAEPATSVDPAIIDRLTARAEQAETALNVVQDELAALKRSAPLVKAALATLDHENDDHWTTGGEPKVDAVKAALGGDVSRADIEAAAPDFDREAAKAAAQA